MTDIQFNIGTNATVRGTCDKSGPSVQIIAEDTPWGPGAIRTLVLPADRDNSDMTPGTLIKLRNGATGMNLGEYRITVNSDKAGKPWLVMTSAIKADKKDKSAQDTQNVQNGAKPDIPVAPAKSGIVLEMGQRRSYRSKVTVDA
jgi:hypothetical protein